MQGDILEGRDAIQTDLDRLEKLIHENLTMFNMAECKVLNLHWGNLRYAHRVGEELLGSSPAEKDLGVLVGEKLGMSQQHVLTACKANSILGCISRGVAVGREGTVSLCSALVCPYQKYGVQAWGPQHMKDVGLLEQVQRRP